MLLAAFLVSPVLANPSLGTIPLNTIQKGNVSGGIWFGAYPGFSTSAQKSFSLPDYTSIDWARVYVVVYCGHKQNNYDGTADVLFDGDGDGSFEATLGHEILNVPYSYPVNGGTGPVTVNDHCNRVTSDYLMWYDVKSQINGRTVSVKANSNKVSPSFDGRIKCIVLVIAYNDRDGDQVYYWINQGHDPMDPATDAGYEGTTEFSTTDLDTENEREGTAKLSTVYLASVDGSYKFNDETMDSGTPSGPYYGSNSWDVSGTVNGWQDSELKYKCVGSYFKIFLSMLSVQYAEVPAGSITVNSIPPQARIFLDGLETEYLTNATLNGISTEEHTISVQLEDHDEYRPSEEKQVRVRKSETTVVDIILESINGSVDVSSNPEGAWIWLDGINMSVQTPATLENVIIGTHSLSLKIEGFTDNTGEITLAEDETVNVEVELTEQTQSGQGDTNPSGLPDPSGYAGKNLTLFKQGIINGGIDVIPVSSYSGLLDVGASQDYTLDIRLPLNATIREADLYLYTTWSHNTVARLGKPAKIRLTLDGTLLKERNTYSDRKGNGTYDYLVDTTGYNASEIITGPGMHRLTVENSGTKNDAFAVYGAAVVVMYEIPDGHPVAYWIGEGCDILMGGRDTGIDSANATTQLVFPGSINTSALQDAHLLVLSTASSGTDTDENTIFFNGALWQNNLTGGSSRISMADLDVTAFIRQSGNGAGIQSTVLAGRWDYLENRNIFLIMNLTGEQIRKDTFFGNETVKENATAALPTTVQETRVQDTPQPAIPGQNTTFEKNNHRIATGKQLLPITGITWLMTNNSSPDLERSLVLTGITKSIPFATDAQSDPGHLLTNQLMENVTLMSDVPLLSGPIEETINQSGRYYSLRIISNPPGASIFVDYDFTGKTTPDTLRMLPAGTHTISLEMEGFNSVEERIFFSEDSTIRIDLDTFGIHDSDYAQVPEELIDLESYGGILVTSKPSGCPVYIDGHLLKTVTPTLFFGLTNGRHSVMIKNGKNPFPIARKDVWVFNGTISTVTFSEFEIPAGVATSIRVDGYNRSPFTINGIPSNYRIPQAVTLYPDTEFMSIASNGSYVSGYLTYNPDAPEVTVVPWSIPDVPVIIDSEPDGADIFIDGFMSGYSTPHTFYNISMGDHVIAVSRAGYVPMSTRIWITDDQIIRRFILKPYTNGCLKIVSTPPNAKIYIDNVDMKKVTPFAFQYLPIGSYDIKTIINGTFAISYDVTVQPDTCLVVNHTKWTSPKKGKFV
ncbi:MAG: DUF3344 domain-containing protein [Methanoregula sp.]